MWVTPLGRDWGNPHESYPCDLGWPRANSITHLPGEGKDQVKMNTFAETLSGPFVLVLRDGCGFSGFVLAHSLGHETHVNQDSELKQNH